MREPREWDEGYGRQRKPVYTGTDQPKTDEPAEHIEPLNPDAVEKLGDSERVQPEEHARF